MKKLLLITGLILLSFLLSNVALAQDKEKGETLNNISKLSKSKKPEDKAKAFQLTKDYLAKYGKDTDENTKKVQAYFKSERLNNFIKAIDDIKIAEAIEIGEEISIDEPDNSYIPLNLAFGAFQALSKNKDKQYINDGINYAKKALEMFEAGKLPAKFEPFKNKDDATAVLYYVIGNFFIDIDLQTTAVNFYKAFQYDAQVKSFSFPYYMVAVYYEKEYEKLAGEYKTKHEKKTTEDAAMKADQAKLEKLLNRMIDSYARAVKVAEIDKDANKETWNSRLQTIYKFAKQSDAGMTEYVNGIMSTPMPDPNQL